MSTTVSLQPSPFVPLALAGYPARVREVDVAATGICLMYLTVAAVLNMARGFNLPL